MGKGRQKENVGLAGSTKYIYIKSTIVYCPLVGIGNWASRNRGRNGQAGRSGEMH